MNTELMEALTILEKEKNISRESMLEAIEGSLLSSVPAKTILGHRTTSRWSWIRRLATTP